MIDYVDFSVAQADVRFGHQGLTIDLNVSSTGRRRNGSGPLSDGGRSNVGMLGMFKIPSDDMLCADMRYVSRSSKLSTWRSSLGKAQSVGAQIVLIR